MPDDGISVVCPTYNSTNFIQRTLDSLLEQDEFPQEIIFSDDGSDDGTADLIESRRKNFEDRGIDLKILRNVHEGPGYARNRGVAIATQIWIAFLDSDDTWKKKKLQRIHETIRKFPQANCLLHWEEYCRSNGKLRRLKHGQNYDPSQDISFQLYDENFISTSAFVCHRDLILAAGGFDHSLPNGQDYELWLRMSTGMRLQILPEILGSYIEESQSITARPYYLRVLAELRIAWRHRDKGGTILLTWKLLRILFSRQWVYTLLNLLQRREGHSS